MEDFITEDHFSSIKIDLFNDPSDEPEIAKTVEQLAQLPDTQINQQQASTIIKDKIKTSDAVFIKTITLDGM